MLSQHKKQVKAVFFDLDDTLFDHKFSRLKGLVALQRRLHSLAAVSLEQLETEHEKLLSVDYSKVLDRRLSVADGITRRIAKLCFMYGENLSLEEAQSVAKLYNQEYTKNRQPTPGSKELLISLSKYVTLGVVSNGLVETQIEKLRVCGVVDLLELVVISDAVGCRKPGKEIFELALDEAQIKSGEAVYVGDSWGGDILPAVTVGMNAIWLNRYGLQCPNPKLGREISSFVGVDLALFLNW